MSKKDELEALDGSQSYDVIAIRKILWNKFHEWSGGMEGYSLFWSDRQGRQGERAALSEKEGLDCTDSALVMMWLRSGFGGREKREHIVMGVTYQFPRPAGYPQIGYFTSI